MTAPLMSREQASEVLEKIVYERVQSCLQLPELFRFELDLWVAVHECGLGDEEAAREIASQMIGRALHRIADDDERYAMLQPFGQQCDLCEEEAFEHRRKPSTS